MAKKPVDTEDRLDQNSTVDRMRAGGYELSTKLAKRLGLANTTLGRWCAAGSVKSEMIGKKRYILLSSLVEHLGPVQSKIFGLVPEGEETHESDAKRRGGKGRQADRKS